MTKIYFRQYPLVQQIRLPHFKHEKQGHLMKQEAEYYHILTQLTFDRLLLKIKQLEDKCN